MPDNIEPVMNKYSGLITKKQASKLNLIDESDAEKLSDAVTVEYLLQFIMLKKEQTEIINTKYNVSVQDKIYRIFNEFAEKEGKANNNSRILVLGNEGHTMNAVISGTLSKKIDDALFQRGDILLMANAILDVTTAEIEGTKKTKITKIMQSQGMPKELAALQSDQKNIDIVGKISNIGAMPNINKSGLKERIVYECTITDSTASIPVVIWDNPALLIQNAQVGDFLKIEFCNVASNQDTKKIYANRFSRIVIFKK